MKISALFVAVLVAGSALAGPAFCDEPSPTVRGEEAAALANTKWRAIEIDGEAAAGGVTSTLQFQPGGDVNGNGGCNNFRGGVEIKGKTMKFGPLASTMMACEDAKSKQEFRFHSALEKTAAFTVENGELHLIDAAGKTVVRLEKN